MKGEYTDAAVGTRTVTRPVEVETVETVVVEGEPWGR